MNDENNKKISLKTKLLIGGISGSFLSIIIFIVVLLAPLMILGIIDVKGLGGSNGGLGFSSISSASGYWWPIGSSQTETKNGKTYASGAPVSSKSETYPDGVSSYFGPRVAPTAGASQNHGAIDIPVPEGTNIIAPLPGTISYVNTDPSADGCGIYMQMDDIKGNKLLFCHLSQVKKSVGDEVDQGEVIALSGNTGASTGPHLHFGITVNGVKVDPLTYVNIDNPRPEPVKEGGSFISGNDNTQTICLTLKDNGYSDSAVAAIMGNIQAESGYLTVNTNELGCDGLVQWCFGRIASLKSTYGSGWSSIDNQLEFLMYELKNSYTDTNNYLQGNHSASDMAYYFCMHFEVPGESICASGTRQGYANSAYSYVQNGCK